MTELPPCPVCRGPATPAKDKWDDDVPMEDRLVWCGTEACVMYGVTIPLDAWLSLPHVCEDAEQRVDAYHAATVAHLRKEREAEQVAAIHGRESHSFDMACGAVDAACAKKRETLAAVLRSMVVPPSKTEGDGGARDLAPEFPPNCVCDMPEAHLCVGGNGRAGSCPCTCHGVVPIPPPPSFTITAKPLTPAIDHTPRAVPPPESPDVEALTRRLRSLLMGAAELGRQDSRDSVPVPISEVRLIVAALSRPRVTAEALWLRIDGRPQRMMVDGKEVDAVLITKDRLAAALRAVEGTGK